MNTSNLNPNQANFYLFKGYPNCGKSIAAHSFPNSFTFDFDKKIRVVKNYYPDRNFDYEQPSNIIETKKILRELKSNCPFDTIIWDGITKSCDMSISSFINYRNPSATKIDPKTGKEVVNKMMPAGQSMPEIEDYKGELRFAMESMDDLLSICVTNNVNVIVMAHVLRTFYQNAKDKSVVDTKALVSSGQKVGTMIPTLFGERFHFGTKVETNDYGVSNKKYICYVKDCIEESTGTEEWAGNSMNLSDPIDWTDKNFYDVLTKKINKDCSI
jgi:hypothetical protein